MVTTVVAGNPLAPPCLLVPVYQSLAPLPNVAGRRRGGAFAASSGTTFSAPADLQSSHPGVTTNESVTGQNAESRWPSSIEATTSTPPAAFPSQTTSTS